MEDIKPQNAKEYLESEWATVLLNTRRNPCEETFQVLDAFVERYKVFFEGKILAPFSYEALFQLHFPWFYKRLKTPFGSHDWREEFLIRSKDRSIKTYKDERERKICFALKNNDQAVLSDMIATRELTISDFHGGGGVKPNESDASLFMCLHERAAQETRDLIFKELVLPAVTEHDVSIMPLEARVSFYNQYLEILLSFRRPLKEVQEVYEKLPRREDLTLLDQAMIHKHFKVARSLMTHGNDLVRIFLLEGICEEGDLDTLKIALASPHLDRTLEKHNYIMLIRKACEWGHLDIVEYLIEHAPQFGFQLDKDDYEGFVFSACQPGEAAVLEKLCEFIAKTEWKESFFKDNRFFERMVGSLFGIDQDLCLGVLVSLLNRGVPLDLILGKLYGPAELAATLESGFHPPAIRQYLIEEYEKDTKTPDYSAQPETVREVARLMLAYFQNPTEENASRLEKSHVREFLPQMRELDKLFLPASLLTEAVPKEDTQISPHNAEPNEMAEFIVTPHNIGSRTVQQLREWEFIELIRAALRNPTTENAFNVGDYLEKYGKDFSADVMAYYEKSKPIFVFPLAALPKDVFRLMLFRVPRNNWVNVARVDTSFPPRVRDAADAALEVEFRYRYPREYQRILRANPHGNINWKAKLEEADKRAYADLSEEHAQLFRAVRDPSRNVDAVKWVLRRMDGRMEFLLIGDAVEGENIYQFACRNHLQPMLNAIYARTCKCLSQEDSSNRDVLVSKLIRPLLRVGAAVLCHQSLTEVGTLFRELDRANPDFNNSCHELLKKAILVENIDAANFLFEQTEMKLDATFLNHALNQYNSIVMTWWLIAHGADLKAFLTPAKMKTGRDVDDPAELAFKKLIELTVEKCEHDKKFQGHARKVLVDVISKYAKPFYEWHLEEENPVRDSYRSKTDLAEEKARRDKNRVIYKALQALLKVMRDPLNEEALSDLQKPDIQKGLATEEVDWLYAVCTPFFPRPTPTAHPAPTQGKK